MTNPTFPISVSSSFQLLDKRISRSSSQTSLSSPWKYQDTSVPYQANSLFLSEDSIGV
jgi:hypothetical protein